MFYVYILKCKDGSYYTGHTDDIEKRISEHRSGLSTYTRSKLPVKVEFTQAFSERHEALDAEMKIKKWSQKKKEALIKGDFNLISDLGKKNFKK